MAINNNTVFHQSKMLSNPHHFHRLCRKAGVSRILLEEAKACRGGLGASTCFKGRSVRNTDEDHTHITSGQLDVWIRTLLYSEEHPEEEDRDNFSVRVVEPTEDWYAFVRLVRTSISAEEKSSWSNLSNSKLAKEAKKFGMTFGTANSKALLSLRERMESMFERRRTLIWNKSDDELDIKESENDLEISEYNMMNIFQLRELCKKRGIVTYHHHKQQLIEHLREQEAPSALCHLSYADMNTNQLKLVAKDKGLLEYNNLGKNQLLDAILQFDETEEKKREIQDKLILGGVEIVARREDNYISATQLCNAGKKEYSNWAKTGKTTEFLIELASVLDIPKDQLIKTKQGGIAGDQGTWVHPRVAINIAQWVSPKFAVNVTGWIQQLLTTCQVSIQRPIRALTDLSEVDVEAEQLEMALDKDIARYTNCVALYVAYIGEEMVKVGYSDSKLLNRLKKHQNSESLYKQWRLISLEEISGRPVEKEVHEFLTPYRAVFQQQKEIYKISHMTLTNFVRKIAKFLEENDLKMTVRKLREENSRLKEENLELKLAASGR